jgi:hypothetical protein
MDKCRQKYVCNNCNKPVSKFKKHLCFIQNVDLKPPGNKYIFGDFETFTNEKTRQIVNLAIFKKYVEEPPRESDITVDDDDILRHSENYYNGYFVFFNIHDAFKWLVSEDHKNYTVIFHNGSGFDYNFILQEFFRNNITPKMINNGSNIKYIHLRKINMRFIDSYLFIVSPLKKFPKMFDIKELKKGYFPHDFNKPENFDYIGPYPDISHYHPECMKSEERDDFIQ